MGETGATFIQIILNHQIWASIALQVWFFWPQTTAQPPKHGTPNFKESLCGCPRLSLGGGTPRLALAPLLRCSLPWRRQHRRRCGLGGDPGSYRAGGLGSALVGRIHGDTGRVADGEDGVRWGPRAVGVRLKVKVLVSDFKGPG